VSLVVLTLVLVALGLLASGLAVTSAMRTNLTDRIDTSLVEGTNTWARPRGDVDQGPRPDHTPGPRRPPSEFFVRLSISGRAPITFSDFEAAPDLSSLPSTDAGPLTVDSVNGSGPHWRVIQRADEDGVVVVATPLADVDETLHRLIWLQLGIGALVVGVVGVLGYLLVHSSLRPLRRVEETAEAIAGGDLTRRVPPGPSNTEVGSLADSLNAMLGQIQQAFAATAQSEQQARASEEQARASEERMRRFIADASHELRTPLTSIKGFAELMRAGAVADTGDAVGRISSEADRMGLLVEDLLMLARLDAHRPLHQMPLEVLGLVDDAVTAARAAAPERSISVDDRTDGEEPVVDGDPQRLTQVLRNLIGNAIMHTPPEATITVGVSANEREVLVQVADTGPGISAEQAERVFDRFYRGDASRTRESATAGSGLGLSIVAALVGAHGGRVGVDPGPGRGARFWFALPRLIVDDEPADAT